MVNSDDRAGKLAWELTADTLLYTAAVAPEIADDIVNIDNAMRWGFNWEAGPFQTWDALGVEALAKRMTAEGRTLPPLVEDVLGNGTGSFYTQTPTRSLLRFHRASLSAAAADQRRSASTMAASRRAASVVKENRSASLMDLGDGVLGVEFHTKMNAIDDDIAGDAARRPSRRRKTNWRAIVIGNDAPDFCVGANSCAGPHGREDAAVGADREGVTRLPAGESGAQVQPDVPVVVAPAGRTLGGGAEIVMHGQKVRAAAETYIGLVEVGAGRASRRAAAAKSCWRAGSR